VAQTGGTTGGKKLVAKGLVAKLVAKQLVATTTTKRPKSSWLRLMLLALHNQQGRKKLVAKTGELLVVEPLVAQTGGNKRVAILPIMCQ
jgi:hypothetical protein